MNTHSSNENRCRGCGGPVTGDAPLCPACRTAPPASPRKTESGFSRSTSLITGIIWINALFFVIALALYPFRWDLSSPLNALSPSPRALFLLGATGTAPFLKVHRFWSLITAGYLHGSLLHILFNMIAVYHLGRISLMIFGTPKTFLIYTVSSIAGFGASLAANVPLTIGASASVCGLIGAILIFSRGNPHPMGRLLYRQTTGWLVGLVMIGLLPNVNNWGHGGGLVAGVVLGRLMGSRLTPARTAQTPPGEWICRALALSLGALVLFSLARALAFALLSRF